MEIVLIRHGRPVAATNPKLDVSQYIDWIEAYRISAVAEDSHPSYSNEQFKEHFILSSDLVRAVHSCQILMAKEPDVIAPIFREMDIPHYNLGIRLKAWTWVYVSRLLWFCGVKGNFESFQQGKNRAALAANELVSAAQKHGKVMLFGHGVTIHFIRKELRKRGWLVEQKSQDYWGVNKLKLKQD